MQQIKTTLTIFIHATEDLVDFFFGDIDLGRLEGLVQLIGIYGTSSIAVEQIKHLAKRLQIKTVKYTN